MTKKIWTVRVIMYLNHSLNPPIPGVWLEQFRHMGLLRVLSELEDRLVVEIFCPHKSLDTQTWATMEAERMHSFMLNAVAAPMWDGREEMK